MLGYRVDSSPRSPDMIFSGVRFVLFGFDSVSEAQYRSELVRRGGVDVGQYDSSCTHVIVSGHVYDDPPCIVARSNGRVLVTDLWIDDSVDLGVLADATRVLYRPVRDFNGIPGCESMCICLTGYQRQERDDIMKMVALMGARFSKPLIANQVTHLICYKFEGEKYELAKKVNIRLVNHRWLEDCLKAWEILPVDDYTKSGCELEILEAQARDSEEETEDLSRKAMMLRTISKSSHLKGAVQHFTSSIVSNSKQEAFNSLQDNLAEKDLHGDETFLDKSRLFHAPCKELSSTKVVDNVNEKLFKDLNHQVGERSEQAANGLVIANAVSGREASPFNSMVRNEGGPLSPTTGGTKRCSPCNVIDEKFCALSYSRKTPKKVVSEKEISYGSHSSPQGKPGAKKGSLDFSKLATTSNGGSAGTPSPTASVSVSHVAVCTSALPQKRKVSLSGVALRTTKLGLKNSPTRATESPLACTEIMQPGLSSTSPQNEINSVITSRENSPGGAFPSNSTGKQMTVASEQKVLCYKSKSLKDSQYKLEAETSKTPNISDVKFADLPVCHPRGEASNELETAVANPAISPIDLNRHLELQVNAELGQKLDKDINVRDAARSIDDIQEAKALETSMTNLQKDESPAKFSNVGEVARSVVADLMSKETEQPQHPHQDKGRLCPDSRDSAFSKSPGITSDLQKTTTKGLKGAEIKKVAARRKLTCRNKLHANKTSTVNIVTGSCSDKISIPAEALVKAGKGRKVEAEPGVERLTTATDLEELGKEEACQKIKSGKSCSREDMIMKDKVNVLHHQMSENKEDKVMKSMGKSNGKVKVAEDILLECNTKNLDTEFAETCMDSEKVNKAKENGGLDLNSSKFKQKLADTHKKEQAMNRKGENGENNTEMLISRSKVGSQPMCFIVSGHRFQRKEFRTVIRQLRGKSCRDSHQWSYQATHFIAPEPLRRTEKFFAAAASGRWILKTDYLTASSKAGKFLEEEQFEWYSKGLSEDGAISFEAPRNWRILRERTGHGAFYGMRIIIYGDCIAPSLDTLKRVVKSGDGTIAATSPPYTRFLESGVDYAIVSASMPCVDMWIQEFLRHEIPCVVADYLVDYVCKPGYSLDRHVLYKTHAWAERSFANLLALSEGICC